MARVTIEDCLVTVPNSFELIAMAAQRVRDIAAGAPLTVDEDNDKKPVIALREIAAATVDPADLMEGAIRRFQRRLADDDLLPADGDAFEAMTEEEIAQMQAAKPGGDSTVRRRRRQHEGIGAEFDDDASDEDQWSDDL